MPQSKPAMDAGLTARSIPVTCKGTSEGGAAVGDGCTVEEVEVAPGAGTVEEVVPDAGTVEEVAPGVSAVEEVEVAPGVCPFGREPKAV